MMYEFFLFASVTAISISFSSYIFIFLYVYCSGTIHSSMFMYFFQIIVIDGHSWCICYMQKLTPGCWLDFICLFVCLMVLILFLSHRTRISRPMPMVTKRNKMLMEYKSYTTLSHMKFNRIKVFLLFSFIPIQLRS